MISIFRSTLLHCEQVVSAIVSARFDTYKRSALLSPVVVSSPPSVHHGRHREAEHLLSRRIQGRCRKGQRFHQFQQEHHCKVRQPSLSSCRVSRFTLSFSRIKNPLAGIPKAQLLSDVEQFAKEREMTDISDLLKRGALVAQDPASFETIEELSEDEKIALRRETTHKWSQPRTLYFTVILCSIGAAVQYVLDPLF